ncbi:MAG: alpha/beta hydrolase fold domain-containing protein, partial [Perlucidibaca sp.]
HPFPAAIDDSLTAWQALISRHPGPPPCVAGESAGGNLALLLCQRLRDLGLTRPGRAWLLSPWLDIALASEDHGPDFQEDLMLGPDAPAARDWVRLRFSAAYAPGLQLDDPSLSPVNGRLDGLPPLFVQAGSNEIFAADSLRLQQRASAVGSDVTLEVWRGMPHAFAFFTPWLPEGRSALRRAGHWLRHAQPAAHDAISPL